MNNNNSRRKAQSWPYPQHEAFEERLRQSNADWFARRGCAVNKRMPYLLDRWEDWPQNIILPEVALYIQSERELCIQIRKPFPLHKYVHHGLSSQAMLFNLAGPLIVADNLKPLLEALRSIGVEWSSETGTAMFEMENREVFNEDAGQPTSIDLVIQNQDEPRPLFIESKLVEREFGGCSVFANGDCDGKNPLDDLGHCYLHHIGRRYWTLMQKYGFTEGLAGKSPICSFTAYYQFFREVIFALESGGIFVLLYDQRNPTFYCGESGERGLMPFLMSFVPQELKSRIHSISIQQVVKTYQEVADFSWLEEFKKKYALD